MFAEILMLLVLAPHAGMANQSGGALRPSEVPWPRHAGIAF